MGRVVAYIYFIGWDATLPVKLMTQLSRAKLRKGKNVEGRRERGGGGKEQCARDE